MKKTTKIDIRKPKGSDSSDVSMTCSCQILYDTSLSNIGDSQCDCSQCLQANLNAFNQCRLEQNRLNTKKHAKNTKSTSKDIRNTNSRGDSVRETKDHLNRYRSTDNFKQQNNKVTKNNRFGYKKRWREGHSESENQQQYNDYGPEGLKATNQQLNEYLIITRNRTRNYIQKRKKLENDEKQEKQKLKHKIKANLEILKMTAQMKLQENQKNNDQPQYKWNHSKYFCACNKNLKKALKNTTKNPSKEKTYECCRKIKIKGELDTNMDKFVQNYKENRQQILKGLKQAKEAQKNVQEQVCPYDKCMNHHNRTDEQKIKKIQNYITKQAKKYQKNKQKQKLKRQQQQKTRLAKLRAIDLKSKQILSRTKKYDNNISRTSFKNSIDNYDTFSQLRQQNQRRKQARENKRKVHQAMKQGGGDLQRAIYEQFEEQQEGLGEQGKSWGFSQDKSQNKVKATLKKQDIEPNNFENQQWCQRILYDAKITAPKQVKKAKNTKKQTKGKLDQRKTRKLNSQKQQQARKRLQKEIQRKRRQIAEEYAKRNTNRQPANKRIRQDYQESKKPKNKQKKQSVNGKGKKDPYRTNYKYQAQKDINQINAHGDPLLQEYVYHDGQRLKAAVNVKDQQIFTQNINGLTSKHRLKL